MGLLNEIFTPTLSDMDENFIRRLKYSWVNPNDEANSSHFYGGYLFGSKEKDQQFHLDYPTIYHLRQKLVIDDSKHDLREIYLAIHHIVKYRGNFLNPAEKINTENAFNAKHFSDGLDNYISYVSDDNFAVSITDLIEFEKAVTNLKLKNNSQRIDAAKAAMSFDSKNNRVRVESILKAILGNQADLSKIFNKEIENKDDLKKWKIFFSDETIDDEIEGLRGELTEEENEFLDNLKEAYDGLTLKSILGDENSISAAMVRSYDNYHRDWETIKTQVRNSSNSKEIKRAYALIISPDEDIIKKGREAFKKIISESSVADSVKNDLLNKIENDTFLVKQRTKRNGVLPNQLHVQELEQIINKQSKFYPFLADTFTQEGKTQFKLVALAKFRVPYYVGPLVEKDKVTGDGTNHWMIRKDETGVITPWNFSEKVDKDASGGQFIKRLTGTDTYLIGEETLAENSLCYQKFNVLQELNNIRIDNNGRYSRLSVVDKQNIYEHIFKQQRNVSAADISNYLESQYGKRVMITGLSSNEKKFNSSLKSFHDLKKNFTDDFLNDPVNNKVLEDIIELQTVFEDKQVLHHNLSKIAILTQEQIDKLSNTHYTGWGRLSSKLLNTRMVSIQLTNDLENQKHSILESLYDSDKNLMEIITDDTLGAKQWIEKENNAQAKDSSIGDLINDLAGAPDIKRGIRQSFAILDDLEKAIGNKPDRVYLEFARENHGSAQKNSRLSAVQKLYKTIQKSGVLAEISRELENETKEHLQDDQLFLYYLQQGKDMYTGKSIDLDKISANYDIDHIIPQAYIKDDSLDNRVLVNKESNARKTDSPFYLQDVQEKQRAFWQSLAQQGFMSKEKLRRLTRRGTDFSENEKEHFIARQLVETRQIIKNVASLIDTYYKGEVKAVAIRSAQTSDMRRYLHVNKNRDINDFHHGFDALMISTVGKYIERRNPKSDKVFLYNDFDHYSKEWLKKSRVDHKDDSARVNTFGYIVGSMRSASNLNRINKETGELVWNETDKQYLLRVLNYKNINVTRMSGIHDGKLYNETIYKKCFA
ncbi:type II CRISPR RNA-guided endonuclease Cas9 [Oenococcus sicerae]|uniref:Type II CRISPR RNA-guided endonuclease Cas9 n=1 Tax=Oenococcus sicerae TaxID=2203724 RepID=A0AAJ1VLX2_9LACO|nr:type II CRISPR RNA-guided endonuclease Cas9 [Oenococcus sicerae]